MEKKTMLIAGIAAVGGILLLARGAGAEGPPEDEPGEGTIDIVVLGPDGKPVPQV